MLLVYVSLTGNVKSFVERSGFNSHEISPTYPFVEVNQDYIVVVPSYEDYINEEVEDFIEYGNNLIHLVGFASSGNLNFNDLFCINAKQLSKKYKKPIMFTFEYEGTSDDIEKFKEVLNAVTRTKQKD